MNQFWPFFLTGFFPCFLVLVGMFVNGRETRNLRDEMRAGFADLREEMRTSIAALREQIHDLQNQITHLVDLHINHAERIAILEKQPPKKP